MAKRCAPPFLKENNKSFTFNYTVHTLSHVESAWRKKKLLEALGPAEDLRGSNEQKYG